MAQGDSPGRELYVYNGERVRLAHRFVPALGNAGYGGSFYAFTDRLQRMFRLSAGRPYEMDTAGRVRVAPQRQDAYTFHLFKPYPLGRVDSASAASRLYVYDTSGNRVIDFLTGGYIYDVIPFGQHVFFSGRTTGGGYAFYHLGPEALVAARPALPPAGGLRL